MSSPIPAGSRLSSRFEQLRLARDILRQEGEALVRLSRGLDEAFCDAVALVAACRGNVLVSGMGKAGHVGQKIAATLTSTGTRSFFLHPAEAVHGDLGRVQSGDVALILSQSGETAEVVQILPSLAAAEVPVIAITARSTSTLARSAQHTISLGNLQEACPLGVAPSTSTTAMLALGDALALVASAMRGFRREDFARYHPGGSLGRHLARVEDAMRPLSDCRVASESETVRAVFVERRRPGRRSGAIMLVDTEGKLSGLFTDSDLARLLENRRDGEIDGPIAHLMTRDPKSVLAGSMLADAVKMMASRKISELPVVDATGVPLGMVDVTDIVTLLPDEHAREWADSHAATTPMSETGGQKVNVAGQDAERGQRLFATEDSQCEESRPTTLPFANRKAGENRI
ncbi:MAG: KpsF/GutQ family sugar-phosphate isomerase [Pirellulales bacterium]